MSVYGGERQVVAVAELVYELLEGGILCRCACVFGCFAVGVASSDIADAYAVGVAAFAVRSWLVDVSAVLDSSVGVYDVVVSDVGESSLDVPSAYGFDAVVASLWGRRAVYYDFPDCSHIN